MAAPRSMPSSGAGFSAVLVAAGAALAGGCGGAAAPIQAARFHNRAPVLRVNDRVPVAAEPEEEGFARGLYFFDRFYYRRVARALELPAPSHAANVNALDDVPDSTWFTNRIGLGTLTPDAIRRGPNVDDGPDRSAPWQITGTKVGGASTGFIMKDARGVGYILKFDVKGIPELETAANVVVQRLLWAAGFNVPEDSIVTFTRDQLALADGAQISDTFGNKRPMTVEDLERALARVNRGADGTYRGMASKFLAGKPLGGVIPEGVRPDDPNDRIPHQNRRELRGQYVLFSWVDHTDVKSDNMLDMLVEDPEDPQKKFVLHYLVDFGKALGAFGWIERRPADGFGYVMDLGFMVRSMLALGLWRRPWEDADGPPLVGVGRFEADLFEPHSYKPQYPWEPFLRMDRFDGLWGAKILAAFQPRHIWAAVEAGQYSDPRAAKYIYTTLLRRREKIVRYWFGEVSPLDRFEVRADALCFDDLSVVHRVFTGAETTDYRARAFDHSGNDLGWSGEVAAGSGGDRTACVTGLPASPSPEGYVVVRITPYLYGAERLPVEAHLARAPEGGLRVIGLVRH